MKKTYGPPRPVVNDAAKREDAIKRNLPARFEIRNNPEAGDASGFFDDVWNADSYGRTAVQEHHHRILRYSEKYDLDPDLVRAVMFAENARGHKVFLNWAGDVSGLSKSIMPMNIQKNRWSSLVDKSPEDMYDPDVNVEAGTLLLSRLRDRIEKPTPEKIGTLWNTLKEKETNVFGNYIGKLYREKPWKKLD
jgi:soluble lytic murein transglycosylase-like protein